MTPKKQNERFITCNFLIKSLIHFSEGRRSAERRGSESSHLLIKE
jgi:hypothetical protein